MEQEDNQSVCEHQTSEDRGMGSDFENSEDQDREGDPEERGVCSDPQDTEERGHLEQQVDSNPPGDDLRGDSQERDIVFAVCSGEKTEYPLRLQNSHLLTWDSTGIQPGPASWGPRGGLSRGH